ncbi:hypothetical protein [Flavobacterium sp. K5-23]|uniref:hypothetical protein n=1 Tax=Flavobacterium sp. K5-23 TaxID=2746225 RepID=UPI002010BD2A|nr:hypothetical protein [Flavobacterium sp. K5-23]UQD55869.1 hypothetical protein FLAK523_05440 [Flavobacterium sp. K5-23]
MFKNKKDFLDEVYNSDRLENRSNYLVFSEYELTYYINLVEHLKEYEDNTQNSFIENEILSFKTALEVIEYIENLEEFKNEDIETTFSNEEVVINFKNLFFKNKTIDEFRTIKEVRASIEKILLFLNNKKANQFNENEVFVIQNDVSKVQKKQKHENIFCNNGFELFEYILKEHIRPVNTKGRQSDLIFYYWKMYNNKPQFIHQRPTEFFTWFDKEYSETSGQLKTYDNVKTTPKEEDFSLALDWFKLQNH